jgi:hypothetical protein
MGPKMDEVPKKKTVNELQLFCVLFLDFLTLEDGIDILS